MIFTQSIIGVTHTISSNSGITMRVEHVYCGYFFLASVIHFFIMILSTLRRSLQVMQYTKVPSPLRASQLRFERLFLTNCHARARQNAKRVICDVSSHTKCLIVRYTLISVIVKRNEKTRQAQRIVVHVSSIEST